MSQISLELQFFLSRHVLSICMFNTHYVDVQFKWSAVQDYSVALR